MICFLVGVADSTIGCSVFGRVAVGDGVAVPVTDSAPDNVSPSRFPMVTLVNLTSVFEEREMKL
jgi:hypothetical protein